MFKKIQTYVQDSYDELVHKVSWPTMAELQSSAVVVSIGALIIAVIVFAMDITFGAHPGAWKGILGYIYGILN